MESPYFHRRNAHTIKIYYSLKKFLQREKWTAIYNKCTACKQIIHEANSITQSRVDKEQKKNISQSMSQIYHNLSTICSWQMGQPCIIMKVRNKLKANLIKVVSFRSTPYYMERMSKPLLKGQYDILCKIRNLGDKTLGASSAPILTSWQPVN